MEITARTYHSGYIGEFTQGDARWKPPSTAGGSKPILRDRPHLVRALVQVVDLKFGNTANLPRYAEETGRPPDEPPIMFKKRCLQFLAHLSERQVMAEVTGNLLSRGFLGLAANERPPAPTAMGHAYARLWADRFLSMFNRIVARARSHGHITGDGPVLDRTAISPSDAPGPRMSTKTPTNGFYGDTRPLARDAASELIVAVPVTPDHEPDRAHVLPLSIGRSTAAVADKGVRLVPESPVATAAAQYRRHSSDAAWARRPRRKGFLRPMD